MATLTLKNLPDDLHQRLKERAARHRRSLNSEILAALEASVKAEPLDPRAFIEQVRRLRPRGHERFTQEDFESGKKAGRA
jgi:plasmid stability protein